MSPLTHCGMPPIHRECHDQGGRRQRRL